MNKRFISIKTKLTIGVILICLVIGAVAVASVFKISGDIIDKEYCDRAEAVAEAVAYAIDADDLNELKEAVLEVYGDGKSVVPSTEWGSDEWNEYQAQYDDIRNLPAFSRVQEKFRDYQEIYDVECIYSTTYKIKAMHAIYIIDGAYGEDECPPGCVDSFDDGIWPDEAHPIVPATITNEEVYGWLVTAVYPVMRDGKIVSFICVDISMDDVKAKERRYVLTTAAAMVILTIIMLIIALVYVDRSMIKPVIKLSETAKNYCSENRDVVHHAFEKIDIKNSDEIGQLLDSMKQMETDMNKNINSLVDTKVALMESQQKAQSMQELAIKDPLTGIRNKTAYDHEVSVLEKDLADGFNEFGLAMVDLNFLKKTNDTYGHEKGNISIRRLCMLVCEVFDHSPVFRIGGDEFIVVLKFRDYKNIDSLIEDFNARLEAVQADDELQPWEKISAAIGYAKYDKTMDKTVDDVFKRADKAMYERKVAMKAERKD